MKVKQCVLIGRVTWGSTFSQVARKHSLIQIESQDINKGIYLRGWERGQWEIGGIRGKRGLEGKQTFIVYLIIVFEYFTMCLDKIFF